MSTEPELDETQQYAVDLALAGKSFMISGHAGVGKSFVLKRIIETLRTRQSKNVVVTSSTGISAQNIDGTTLHAFAGIGLGELDADELVLRVRSSQRAMARWRQCDVLVIDEISMISKDLFTKVEYVAQVIRRSEEPFGGIQLVASGDFGQLPAVDRNSPQTFYAFESPAWPSCVPHAVMLTKIYRQRPNEPNYVQFIEGLAQLRNGVLTPAFARLLQSCTTQPVGSTGIIPTCLYAHNVDVDAMNYEELRKLKGPAHEFKAVTKILMRTPEYLNMKPETLDGLFPVAPSITLKVGAQVMFQKNTDLYCNGTRGVVTGFVYEETESEEEEDEDSEQETPPPKKARKSATPEGVMVRLTNGSEIPVRPLVFEHTANKTTVASRVALPLKLAWSTTIHKSQGQSLDSVEIHLEKATRPTSGLVYVAISRATTLTNLKVYGLDRCCVFADPRVKAFYKAIQDQPKVEGLDKQSLMEKFQYHAA